MTRLALTVQPSAFESATSWASRLADRNGASHVQDFVHDMGLVWKAFIGGDARTVLALCNLAGVEPSTVLRHATRRDEGGSRWLGREVIGAKLLLNREMSVCARCVAEARSKETGRLEAGARVWWQIEPVRTCYRPRVMLTQLPPPPTGRCKYDFVGRVRDNWDLLRRAAERPSWSPMRFFDLYMISRVCGEKRLRSRWLDSLDLRIAAQACQTLGIVLKRRAMVRSDVNSPAFLSAAADLGFRTLVQGSKTMWPAMQKVQDRPSVRGSGFYTDFRPFAMFVDKLEDGPGTQVLRDEVRRYVEHNYPVGPGEEVLGRPVEQRRLHSVVTAAEKAGTSWTRTRGVLQAIRDTGAVSYLTPPDRNFWISCEEWDPWLERYGRSLNIKRAAERLGCSFQFFHKIQKTEWITPFISLPGHVDRYDPEELDPMLASFLDGRPEISARDQDMVELFAVQSRCRCSSMSVLELIRTNRLPFVGRQAGAHGLRSLLVRRDEVLDALETEPHEGLASDDARRFLGINTSTLSWLIQQKLLEVERVSHHRTRESMAIIRHDMLCAFLARYETLGRLARVEQTQAKHVAARLARFGVHPLPLPEHFSRIYLREDLPQR